jgi:hypothetical protein
VQSYNGYGTFSFWLYFLCSTLGGGLLNGATFWCTINNSAVTTRYSFFESGKTHDSFLVCSVVGVLKSILQIFVGMFVFDRLPINANTVTGILLSLVAGTMFSYFEYTAKKSKSVASMKNIDCEQKNQQYINPSLDEQEMEMTSAKCVYFSFLRHSLLSVVKRKQWFHSS